jgi:hypothetical protein
MLDWDSELSQPAFAPRLRVHKLGHTLGASHVTSHASFMNPDVTGSLPTRRTKRRSASRRPPGSRSPDGDPSDFTLMLRSGLGLQPSVAA